MSFPKETHIYHIQLLKLTRPEHFKEMYFFWSHIQIFLRWHLIKVSTIKIMKNIYICDYVLYYWTYLNSSWIDYHNNIFLGLISICFETNELLSSNTILNLKWCDKFYKAIAYKAKWTIMWAIYPIFSLKWYIIFLEN